MLACRTVFKLPDEEVRSAKVRYDLVDMLRPSGFDHSVDLRKLGRHIIEQPLVIDFDDITATSD